MYIDEVNNVDKVKIIKAVLSIMVHLSIYWYKNETNAFLGPLCIQLPQI